MKCVVTAGPTYEPLDEVRRLTNFSTGRLGSELADYLVERGHEVVLLLGMNATYQGEQKAQRKRVFTTTEDLRQKLEELAGKEIGGVFHAAAVSDFTFGKVWERSPSGELTELTDRKISTRKGNLLAELVPTVKLIGELRGWFPTARLVGWKYELDGSREELMEKGRQQLRQNRTDACVLNGSAYGRGFGLLGRQGECAHWATRAELYGALNEMLGA
jgi:phosphopantothenoylcysteine decarboxylase/phosphopantothenate--cysteine ligase